MNRIRLTIPQVPLSINQTRRMHWAELNEVKQLWKDEVWHAKRMFAENRQNYPNQYYSPTDYPPLKKAKMSIKIFFRTNARRDADNYSCKEVIDAIKNNGLIEDDDYEHIGRTEIDITGTDKNNPRTIIEIEEI